MTSQGGIREGDFHPSNRDLLPFGAHYLAGSHFVEWLARTYGLQFVGYYLSTAAILTILGILMTPETKDANIAQ